MIDICPKKQPQVTPPTQIKRQSYPWKIFKPRQLLFSVSPPSSFQFNSQNETQIFFEPLPLTLSLSSSFLSNLIPEIKHYSLFHTQTPFHPQLPLPFSRCHGALPPPLVWVLRVTTKHHQSNETGHYILWKSPLLFLASPAVWRTRAIFLLTDSEAQPPKRVIFPFYLFRFSTFSHLLFHFLIFLQL